MENEQNEISKFKTEIDDLKKSISELKSEKDAEIGKIKKDFEDYKKTVRKMIEEIPKGKANRVIAIISSIVSIIVSVVWLLSMLVF